MYTLGTTCEFKSVHYAFNGAKGLLYRKYKKVFFIAHEKYIHKQCQNKKKKELEECD